MPVSPMKTDRKAVPETVDVPIPTAIAAQVNRFMLDRRTGNVVLNIRDGEILKAVIEDHIRAS